MSWAGQRHGPRPTGNGMTVWVRRIAGTNWIFWAWPDAIAIYREQPDRPPHLAHYLTKET